MYRSWEATDRAAVDLRQSPNPHRALSRRPITVDDYFDINRSCLYGRTGDADLLSTTVDLDADGASLGGRRIGPEGLARERRRAEDAALSAHREAQEAAARRRQATAETAVAVVPASRGGAPSAPAATGQPSFELDEDEGAPDPGNAIFAALAGLSEKQTPRDDLAAVGGDALLHDLVLHCRELPLHTEPQRLIRPKTAAAFASGDARAMRPVKPAVLRTNVARAKWGPVTLGDPSVVAFRDKMDAELAAVRSAFAAKSTAITLPDQVPQEALDYAPSRFGTEFEMFDAARHSDFDAKERHRVRDEVRKRRDDWLRGGTAEEARDAGITTQDSMRRAEEDHERLARAKGFELHEVEEDRPRWDWTGPEPSELVKQYRANRPEWVKRRLAVAQGLLPAEVHDDPGYTPDRAKRPGGAQQLLEAQKVESLAKPYKPKFSPGRSRSEWDAVLEPQPAGQHASTAATPVTPVAEERLGLEPPPVVVAAGPSGGATGRRVVKTTYKGLDGDDVTVAVRKPAPFVPRANPPRFRGEYEPPPEANAAASSAWNSWGVWSLDAYAAGVDAAATVAAAASPRHRAASAAAARKVATGGQENALATFIDAAQRPAERRTHTSAILPFFSSGVQGFDPVLAKDVHMVPYSDVVPVADDRPFSSSSFAPPLDVDQMTVASSARS